MIINVSTEVLYQTSLVSSIILCPLLRYIPAGQPRSIFCSSVGLTTVVAFGGKELIPFLLIYLGAYSIIGVTLATRPGADGPVDEGESAETASDGKRTDVDIHPVASKPSEHRTPLKKATPNISTWASFISSPGAITLIFSFSVISAVRFLEVINLVDLGGRGNIVFLVHCLKVIGAAFKAGDRNQQYNFFDFTHYVFFFPALWSGPYVDIDYVTDFLKRPYSELKTLRLGQLCFRRIRTTFLYAVAYVAVPMIFPGATKAMYQDDRSYEVLYNTNLVSQYIYLHIYYLHARSRLISAFFIGELCCLLAGVGYDPSRPHGIDAHALRSTDEFCIELPQTMAQVIRSWNMSVQTWMVLYVYKRVPFRKSILRRSLVMFVSGYWHGIRPGYVAAFVMYGLLQPIQQAAWSVLWSQEAIERMETKKSELLDIKKPKQIVITLIRAFVTWTLLSFTAMSFHWSTLYEMPRVWAAQRFYVIHICLVLTTIIVIGKTKVGLRTMRKITAWFEEDESPQVSADAQLAEKKIN